MYTCIVRYGVYLHSVVEYIIFIHIYIYIVECCVHIVSFDIRINSAGYALCIHGVYSVAKTHRMSHLDRSFSAKEPYN